MTKYLVVSTTKFEDTAKAINEYVNELGHETNFEIVADDLEYAKKIVEASKEIAKPENNREKLALISIDETGGLGFVAASKVKGMVSSQVSDEHSSHMTREHNGSVGLNLGANLTNVELMKSIVKKFTDEKFAAGRHMVRIDMLDCLC